MVCVQGHDNKHIDNLPENITSASCQASGWATGCVASARIPASNQLAKFLAGAHPYKVTRAQGADKVKRGIFCGACEQVSAKKGRTGVRGVYRKEKVDHFLPVLRNLVKTPNHTGAWPRGRDEVALPTGRVDKALPKNRGIGQHVKSCCKRDENKERG
eukprot:1158840-Pelagomonas_calceolata.AAC.5